MCHYRASSISWDRPDGTGGGIKHSDVTRGCGHCSTLASPIVLSLLLLAMLACAPGNVALLTTETPQAAGGQGGAPVTGRVVLQGRGGEPDVTISATRDTGSVTAETVVLGLKVPWALDFAPDGRILVTERSGRIRVIRDGVLQSVPWAVIDVASVSESGLMGLALHPDFSANGHLFVCYSYRDAQGQLSNRVARLTDAGGVGVEHRVILDGIPAARNHNGCRLGFGPDGKLYVTMGDAQAPDQAQVLGSLSGKVLRLEPDGSVPEDNPFPGSYVYTYGHRNPQGLDWHPQTGDLFITEHGPATDDEINILEPGGNYGWPHVLGAASDPRFLDPILSFTPTLALAGAAFYTGDKLPQSWEGNYLFANLRAAHLHRVLLEPPDFRVVRSHQRLFQGEFGRLRAVALSPDGHLYFTTSNRDGRGQPRAGDDKLLRLVAAPTEPAQLFRPSPGGDFALDLAPGKVRLRWSLPGFLAQEREVEASGDGGDLGEIVLLAGDLDGDGDVDADDEQTMKQAFGRPVSDNPVADLNADGVIDVLDLALLGSNWGLTDGRP